MDHWGSLREGAQKSSHWSCHHYHHQKKMLFILGFPSCRHLWILLLYRHTSFEEISLSCLLLESGCMRQMWLIGTIANWKFLILPKFPAFFCGKLTRNCAKLQKKWQLKGSLKQSVFKFIPFITSSLILFLIVLHSPVKMQNHHRVMLVFYIPFYIPS